MGVPVFAVVQLPPSYRAAARAGLSGKGAGKLLMVMGQDVHGEMVEPVELWLS
jgi:hypothetical protein